MYGLVYRVYNQRRCILWYNMRASTIHYERMIQNQSMSQCAVPTQHVSCSMVNMQTLCNSMHKMQIFTILRPHFTIKLVRQFQIHRNRQVPRTVKLHPIKSKVNLPVKIAVISVSNLSSIPRIKQLLLAATTIEI